jgi:MSHA biogenesis protein MshM
LLQVVVFGQPELDDKLNQQSIRQLKQRVTFDYRLTPLTRDDLHYYLNHRLIVAGYQGGRLFSSGALWMLHRRTSGIPRLVNVVAHKAMLSVFGKGKNRVGVTDVLAASDDTVSTRVAGRHMKILAVMLAVVLIAAMVWGVQGQ